MLDTFAKRLNSQYVASPGDISTGDRWAVAGTFRPTYWSTGLILATLGAVAPSLVGANTSPAAEAFTQSDRWHAAYTALPGSQDVYNRYAYVGALLFQGDGTVGGRLLTTVGSVSASIRGTVVNTAVDGRLAQTLGPVTASLRGESYISVFFDLDWSLTPAFTFTDVTAADGALAATLGAVASSVRGTALPPDSTTGLIQTSLGEVVASFAGTMVAPAGRDGRLHIDIEAISTSLRGSVVAPTGVIGGLPITLGDVTASLVGTFVQFTTDGVISSSLEPVTGAFYGQSILPGAIVGLMPGELGAVTCHLSGATFAEKPDVDVGHTYKPERKHRNLLVGRSRRTYRV